MDVEHIQLQGFYYNYVRRIGAAQSAYYIAAFFLTRTLKTSEVFLISVLLGKELLPMSETNPTLLAPCIVNILIVCDGRMHFDTSLDESKDEFSLSLMMEAINEKDSPVARFFIDTAYRPTSEPRGDLETDSTGQGADDKNFTFSKEILEKYDEIWLFGDRAKGTELKPVGEDATSHEKDILSEFMNESGGGIFATGDHSSLGAALNKELPRVRAMRVWTDGPSPNPGTAHRSLTVDNTISTAVPEQHDAIPQKINPRPFLYPDTTEKYPHPVLCGQSGPISVLPDHMHEGDCLEPDIRTFSEEEFPTRKDLIVAPLVIATSSNKDLETPKKDFGAVGAYDGHLVERGRIVVASTFHQFINLNLRGLTDIEKIPQSQRHRTDVGPAAYEEIKNYFSNIALWLAPEVKQREMFLIALWETRWRSRINALLTPGKDKIAPQEINAKLHWKTILHIGKLTREVLSQRTSSCFTLQWTIELGRTFKLFLPDPWAPKKTAPGENTNGSIGNLTKNIVDYLIGGAITGIAVKFPTRTSAGVTRLAGLSREAVISEIDDAVKAGVKSGLTAFSGSLKQQRADLLSLSKKIKEAIVTN